MQTLANVPNPTAALAKLFLERVDHLGFKGKKAYDLALEFWVGAASLAELMEPGCSLSRTMQVQAALLISVRGVMAVREIAAK